MITENAMRRRRTTRDVGCCGDVVRGKRGSETVDDGGWSGRRLSLSTDVGENDLCLVGSKLP